MGTDTENAKKELRAAWDELIGNLERAREAIDDPAAMPPPARERNLAEGYRYLMGYTQLLLGNDVVGYLCCLDSVTRLICLVGFHYTLILTVFFRLSIRFLCFLRWHLRPHLVHDNHLASGEDWFNDILC